MKRKILIVLLALGTLGGYGMGIARLVRVRSHQHARFEQYVERVCERGARRALDRDRGHRAFGPPAGFPHAGPRHPDGRDRAIR
ncbi:MAG: hypothetical protein IT379_29325 [Deltaproteobacteria bacterium]|nr:hypothetical protein [Deltaproteobacteria bacterium]